MKTSPAQIPSTPAAFCKVENDKTVVEVLTFLSWIVAGYLAILIYVLPEQIRAFQEDDRPWSAALRARVSDIVSGTLELLGVLALWVFIGLLAIGLIAGLFMAPITTLLALILLVLVGILFW